MSTRLAEPEEPQVEDVEPDDEPAYIDRDTDTAALLRELSSLGLDDDPPSSPAPVRPPTTSPRPVSGTSTQTKKRKGLFGRG